jgi:hypothetical protein
MLAERIRIALQTEFPEVPFRFGVSDSVASLDSPSSEVGTLDICDDGDEATIYLGSITHAHLGCYDDTLSEEQRADRVTEDVVSFIRALLADRVVGFRALGGMVGGYRMLSHDETKPDRSRFRPLSRLYLWSGPLP